MAIKTHGLLHSIVNIFFNTKDIFLFQPKGVQSNHYKAWNENSSSWSF